jgi:hypothetical protein
MRNIEDNKRQTDDNANACQWRYAPGGQLQINAPLSSVARCSDGKSGDEGETWMMAQRKTSLLRTTLPLVLRCVAKKIPLVLPNRDAYKELRME